MPEARLGDVETVVRISYSMARGFELVLQDWDSFDRADIGTFLKKIAVVITSRIGGTSGPIWGTALLRAATVAGPADSLEPAQIVAMLRASIEGIKMRGRSDVGDKTLLDALAPATDTIEQQAAAGAGAATTLRAAATTARESAEATKSMQAMRGRASYTGERSIGTLDAGAVAIAVIAEALADQWPGTAARS